MHLNVKLFFDNFTLMTYISALIQSNFYPIFLPIIIFLRLIYIKDHPAGPIMVSVTWKIEGLEYAAKDTMNLAAMLRQDPMP